MNTGGTQYETRHVAGAAYARMDDSRACLTHVVDTTTGKPLCKKVKPENLLTAAESDTDPDTPATCPLCAKRDSREHTKPAIDIDGKPLHPDAATYSYQLLSVLMGALYAVDREFQPERVPDGADRWTPHGLAGRQWVEKELFVLITRAGAAGARIPERP